MSTIFPRAVMWDHSAACHMIVHVDRLHGCFVHVCHECAVQEVYPLEFLENFKELIASRDDAQVLLWVEDNG